MFFSCLITPEVNINIISTLNIFEGFRRATILLPRNLIETYSKDSCLNGYHIETNNEWDMKYLYITRIDWIKKCVLEKLSSFSYGLYYTYVSAIETHVIVSEKLMNQNEFLNWHDQLGHPRSIMMQKIVKKLMWTLT